MTQWTTKCLKSNNHLSENEKQREIDALKKELDLRDEENQLLHLDNKRLIEIEQSHKKLTGELYEQIDKVKKEADNLMMNKIIKYEKKIRELKQYAKDMYNYP